MKCMKNAEDIWEIKTKHKIVVNKYKWKRPLGRPRTVSENNIKSDH